MENVVAISSRNSVKLTESYNLDLDRFIDLASQLSDEDRQCEAKLRQDLIQIIGHFVRDRYELGRVLHGYRAIYKAERTWTAFCAAANIKIRTAHRLITAYEAASQVDPEIRRVATERGLSLVAAKNRPILDKIIEMTPEGPIVSESEATAFIERAVSSVTQGPATKAAKSKTHGLDRVYDYVKKHFENIEAGAREAELRQLYRQLNSYFGIGEMVVPFGAAPVLVTSEESQRG
ncbi:MAG TPA: hypothetical protein VN577_04975 [Terriglobales bacterium]|nr:hypothetical protein [Terriglobales bacterium]